MTPFGLEFKDSTAYLYRIEDQQRITIDVRDGEGNKLDLRNFIQGSMEYLFDHWGESWGPDVAASLFVMQSGGEQTSQTTYATAEQFFAMGLLFERIRQRHDVTVKVTVDKMTLEEMEAKLTEIEDGSREEDAD